MERYYNPLGDEILNEKLHGSKPTGFVNFNKPRYKWSKSLYDLMMANTWFPAEIDTSNEKKNFSKLSDNEQELYKYTFAQLSCNDSIQENYLSDFRSLTTNSIVKSSLTIQMYQESNHSLSYAVLLDACGNSDEVFNLYRYDDTLNTKNQRIAKHFSKYINGNSVDNMLLSAVASINLEGIFFLTGFAFIYVLGDKVAGARDMIKFIARDELNTHAPMFKNIFRTIRGENKISTTLIDKVYSMMKEAVNIELTYALYLVNRFPILGLDETIVTNTVNNFANERLVAMGLTSIFPKSNKTNLQELITKHLEMNNIKTNFFEGNNSNYSKGNLSMDF